MADINQDITITSSDGEFDFDPSNEFLSNNSDINSYYQKSQIIK